MATKLEAVPDIKDWLSEKSYNCNLDDIFASHPFEHVVIKEFFNTEVFSRLATKLKSVDAANYHNHPSGKYKFCAFDCRDFFKFIYSVSFKKYLASKTKYVLKNCKAYPYPQIYVYHNASDGVEVHTDHDHNRARDFGMIIYLHEHWDDSYGGELNLFDKYDLKNPKVVIKPEPNTMVLFRITPDSFHSVNPYKKPWLRQTIIVDWDLT